MLASALFTILLAVTGSLSFPQSRPPPAAQQSCKVHPSRAAWPKEEERAALNGLVKGRLIKPYPAAAACHPEHEAYDPDECQSITSRWGSSSFHADDPTSSLWTNVNNYSCLNTPDSACTTAGFPQYVLNATKAEQIAAAISWARDNNIRINIKSTGHDFLGRSTQPNSLSIWVHYLQNMEWHGRGFQPQGCSFTIPGGAVTAGGGTQMGRLTPFVRRYGKSIVAGSSSTVSVGGFITGGGHGTLSGKYGLGADSVLQVELVTADGKIIVANECQNQDLFWATRGGGGSTFGVMTKVTLQAFDSVPVATWRGRISGPRGDNNTWNAIATYHGAWARHLAPVGCTGYTTGNPWGSGSLSVSVNMPGARNYTDLLQRIERVINETVEAGGGDVRMSGSGMWRPANQAREEEEDRPQAPTGTGTVRGGGGFPGNGRNKLITSWLYGFDELTHPNVRQALMGSVDSDSLMYQDFTAGPGTHKPPFMAGGGNAVNPGWRSAIVRPAAELQWSGTDRAKLTRRKNDLLRMGASLRTLGPNMGTYCNEADVDMPEVQKAFWGDNYPKLLEIKKRVDPSGVFYCKSCVGSEYWYETETGGLCRK